MPPGKFLILAGLLLVAVGLLTHFAGRIPFLGKLPGDFHFERENFSFSFPLTTCILISLLVTLILWIFRR
jgi:hypothetical protein